MAGWRLMCCDRELAVIVSADDLERKLTGIHDAQAVRKPIVSLVHPEGHVLTLGISLDLGFLNYVSASRRPLYYSSVGDPSLEPAAGMVTFDCGGETEIPLRNCVRFDVLVKVAKEYFLTGKLSASIVWEMD